jgi:cytoskeletal protein RodZ
LDIAPEYLLAGVLFLVVLAIIAVVSVTALWVVFKPDLPFPQLQEPSTTTLPAIPPETTTTTAQSTTSTTTTTTETTTSTDSTTTTQAPFYVCDNTVTDTNIMVTTRCQETVTNTRGGNAGGTRYYDTKVSATVAYNLTNAAGAYREGVSRIVGTECQYLEVFDKTTMKFSQFISCVKPKNLTTTRPARRVIP